MKEGLDYFNSLPKKDREGIKKYLTARPDVAGSASGDLEKAFIIYQGNVQGLKTRPERAGYAYHTAKQIFASSMHFNADIVLHKAISNRLTQNDVSGLVQAATQASRLKFLELVAEKDDGSSLDAGFVFGLFLSIVAQDTQAVSAYVRTFSGLSFEGHPSTRRLALNTLSMLRGEGPALFSETKPVPGGATIYEKARHEALSFISLGDMEKFLKAVESMLGSYQRTSSAYALQKYWPMEPMAIFNIASTVWPEVENRGKLPQLKHPLWDREFIEASRGIVDLSLISNFSPKVASLASELPERIPEGFCEDL